jgi:hypothetical protein
MTFFLGTKGNVRLRRGTDAQLGSFSNQLLPSDVNTRLNRLSFDDALANILTGDRLEIRTSDPRGLACFPASSWSDSVVRSGINAFVNVNAAGGLRFFRRFQDAVNNERSQEIPLAAFSGDPLEVTVRIRDFDYNILGNVTGYEFNTDRETVDTTALDDRFKQQLSAGLISGAGRIDCAFDYQTTGTKESPLLMMQLIQRLDVGSEFDLALYLTDKTVDPNVDTIFYGLTAVVNRAGVQVRAGDIIDCSIDFLTTGEIRLLVTRPSSFLLTESGAPIGVEQTLAALFQQDDD